MYSFILFTHSWLRWIMLALLTLTLLRSLTGWLKKDQYTEGDKKLRLGTVILFDLQVLIGLYLYTISPIVHSAFESMSEAMKDAQLRFFSMEHTMGMIIAVIVLHIGNALSKKKEPGVKQHKCVAITLIIVVLVTLISIPWPGLPYGRELLRWFN